MAAAPTAYTCSRCSCIDHVLPRREVARIRFKSFDYDTTTRICPRQQIQPFSLACMSLWESYEKGHLLRAGGIGDQPAKYMQAMRVLSAAVAETRAEQLEKERRKAQQSRR